MTTLDPTRTALILIDLQHGILPRAGGPLSGDEVVARARPIAERFRAAGATVVLVHVGFGPDEQPSQMVDKPSLPKDGTPPDFSTLVPGLQQPGDVVVLKHHWGAFTGTDLDLQLRRRGIDTVVVGGIATNLGVESTARSAWELSYHVVIAEDLCSSFTADMHRFAVDQIFPMLARVVQSDQIAFAG